MTLKNEMKKIEKKLKTKMKLKSASRVSQNVTYLQFNVLQLLLWIDFCSLLHTLHKLAITVNLFMIEMPLLHYIFYPSPSHFQSAF